MNIRDIVAFALGPITSAFFTLTTLPILAWIFSPDDIGRITLVQVIISMSFVVCSLALEQAYAREFYEHINRPALLKITFFPGFVVILLMAVFLYGFSVGNLLFDVDNWLVVPLVFSCVVINYVAVYSVLTLRMSGRAFAYSLTTSMAKGVFFVCILIIYFFGVKADFIVLLGSHALSLIMALCVTLWLSRKEWRAALSAPILYRELPSYIRFSWPLIFGGLAYWGLTAVDRIALRWWSDFEQLGIFSVAVSFAGVAVLFQSIFTTVWTPYVYRWNAKGIDSGELNKIVEYVLCAVILIYSSVGSLAWIVGYFLPAKYIIVPYILPACMGGALFYMLSESTGVGINLKRKTLFSLLAALISFLLNVALNYILVRKYGAAGAAVATNLSFFIFLFLRTELSAFVWISFPRGKIYIYALVCSLVSNFGAVFYRELGVVYFAIWLIIFASALFIFKEVLQQCGAGLVSYRLNRNS